MFCNIYNIPSNIQLEKMIFYGLKYIKKTHYINILYNIIIYEIK